MDRQRKPPFVLLASTGAVFLSGKAQCYSSDTSYNFNSLIDISYKEKGNHGDHPSILKFPTVWQGIS